MLLAQRCNSFPIHITGMEPGGGKEGHATLVRKAAPLPHGGNFPLSLGSLNGYMLKYLEVVPNSDRLPLMFYFNLQNGKFSSKNPTTFQLFLTKNPKFLFFTMQAQNFPMFLQRNPRVLKLGAHHSSSNPLPLSRLSMAGPYQGA